MQGAMPPEIDEEKLTAVGERLFKLYGTHITDRKPAEEHWLRNLRQYRGIYDPEILQLIPKDCSKAYPKLTRWKCVGTVARLMQMLFPQTEKNYGVRPSPLPDLSLAQLQEVLDGLVAQAAQAQNIDPRDVQLDDVAIEKAIYDYAKGKSERMEKKIDDDLEEMEFITLARKVVFSAVLYNVGVLEGPMHVKTKARVWQKNVSTGRYEAQEVEKLKPLFEFCPVWSWYPDMTAQTLDTQDGTFKRHVMTRAQVEQLAERKDFLAERVHKWLRDNPSGNYVPQWWESVIKGEPKSDKYAVASKEGRKYEVASYWGGVPGHELRAAGVDISDDDVGKTFQASAWIIGNTVIKMRLAPLDPEVQYYHTFMFEEDDLSLLGNGQCDTLRDSQLSICETARAALDNMSVIGPMVEVNDDLLAPGQDVSIRKHKTWRREGDGAAAAYPAVRDIAINSHLTELQSLLQMFMEFADKESGLPPPSLGDVSGGGSEALRTQRNASMFLGAAALPIRDTVRNYDSFTVSVIGSLVKWNTKYDPNPSRDGDHNIIARGSTSLIAKEVLAQALENFRAGITPDEMPHIKVRKLLEHRAKANDIPIDELLEDDDVAQQNIAAQQQSQQAQLDQQLALVSAQAEQFVTRAVLNVAQARKADGSMSIDTFNAIVDAMQNQHKNTIAEKAADKPAAKAKAA